MNCTNSREETNRLAASTTRTTVVAIFAALVAPAAAAPPQAALQAGYKTRTFVTSHFDDTNVDLKGTDASGFQWYRMNFFKLRNDVVATKVTDGHLVTGGIVYDGTMTTVTRTSRPPYFAGTAFGGGGYFEAEIAFDSEKVDLKEGVWPAWWSLTLESVLQMPASLWKGQQPGYLNTVEVDFFEYDLQGSWRRTKNEYGAGIHHWYGTHGMCGSNRLCDYGSPYSTGIQTAPPNTDWTKFHKFGALWIPATAEHRGSMTFFLDGKTSNEPITWTLFDDDPAPPTAKTPWAFGPLDRMHLILVLGSGKKSPITVRSVEVWQVDDSQNLHN